jgi:type I restriction enzyme, S subunit
MSEAVNIPQLRFPGFSGEWKDKRFDSLYPTVRNGFVGVATPYYVEEGVPYLQGKNIKSGAINKNGLVYINEYFHQKSKKSQLRKNDIVMVQSGHVGECAVITEEFEDTNCHALLVSTPTHDIDSKFYINYFYSKFGRKKIHRITTGNTIKHILSSDLKIQIVSNPSYQEQQKIAAFLTAVDNKIEQLSKKQELLGEYKKGLMQQIFSQAIRFKADDGSEFPDWEEKILSAYLIIKATYGIVKAGEFQDAGIKMVRGGDIKNGRIKPNSPFVSDEISHEYRRTKLELNDVVISLVGYPGESAIIPKDLIGHNISRAVGLLRLNNKINNEYFVQYLNSYSGRKNVLRPSAGSAQQVVNLKDLNILKIPAPQLPEQTKIANFLSSIDNKIEQVGKQLDESKQFKKALLQQMFV